MDEKQEKLREEIRNRWAKLGLTDDLKVQINENVSKLYEEKDTIPLVCRIAAKTVGFDITGVKFEDVGEKIQEIIEKSTNHEFTTNGGNGITEELVGYPTKKGDGNE